MGSQNRDINIFNNDIVYVYVSVKFQSCSVFRLNPEEELVDLNFVWEKYQICRWFRNGISGFAAEKSVNGSQLAKMKKSIPDMSLP